MAPKGYKSLSLPGVALDGLRVARERIQTVGLDAIPAVIRGDVTELTNSTLVDMAMRALALAMKEKTRPI